MFLGERFELDQGFNHYDQSLVLKMRKSHEAISSPAITDKAEALLREKASGGKSKPFFLWIHYFDPHSTYKYHEGFTERFGSELVDRYDGEIAFTDAHIGRLLKTLRELGLEENTVVVFCGGSWRVVLRPRQAWARTDSLPRSDSAAARDSRPRFQGTSRLDAYREP
jgi:membrane-anchored protein YejM (alkaline phosphatase superfamily)